MPRPGMKQEKSKDFKGSLIKLFKNLESWKYLLLTAVVLAMFAAILSTIAPNKLADITDVISDGIKPDVVKLEDISKKIYQSNKKDFIYDDVLITVEDQEKYMEVISTISSDSNNEEMIAKLDQLPDSIKSIIEPKMDTEELTKRSIVLIIIYLLNFVFGYIEGRIMAHVGIGYAKKLRSSISKKINRLPLKYFDNHEAGDVLSRVTNDVDTIGINMSDNITSLVTNVTLFLGSVVMMFVTNWMMALTAILSSIIGFLLSFLLIKKSQKYFAERQEKLGKLNGHIEEMYSGHSIVKSYNGEEEAIKEFETINNRLFDCNRKSQFLSGIMQPVMGFIGNFGYVMVCVVGALLVMNDYISFGVIVAFMIYIRLFTNPLSRIAQSMTTMQSIAAAGERVFEFLEEEELSDESHLVKKIKNGEAIGNIEFRNVKFGYKSDKTIIKNFSANVKAGEKIAIVGPTGAGKTTMVNLLMKFYEINDGDILIDGISIKELSRDNIHRLFIMILQDTWLFNGTIRENLIFNNKKVSEEELWNICKNVGIDHFIKTLPGGMNASVGDNNQISSGEKQLLTIARGMVNDAPFLILDEATSNVDTRTEELVQKAMDKLTVGRTSFIIAHRLSTIKNANLILVMNEGNIVEQGTHEELLKKNGFYANLYNSQFQK